MAGPLVSFLSDYGQHDEFAGVCHGVIAKRCPEARIIDVTHGIPRHDIRAGAIALRSAVRYLPAAVHLAVVDPGVGLEPRRGVALATTIPGRLLVGPDNGLLWLAAQELGGVREAIDIGRSPERLEPVAPTFHGRDLFAPVAAALACGKARGEVGEQVDPETLVQLELPRAHARAGALCAHVLAIDHFGNLTLDATVEQLAELGLALSATLEIERGDPGGDPGGDPALARVGHTFGDVAPGELVLHEDSRGMLALAANQGSAAELLGVSADGELRMRAR